MERLAAAKDGYLTAISLAVYPQSLQALERLHAAECLMQLLEFLLMAVMEMNFVISASGENSPSVIPTFNRKYSVRYSARRGNFCKLGACKMSWIGTGCQDFGWAKDRRLRVAASGTCVTTVSHQR